MERFTICGWFGRNFKMEELKPPTEVEKAFEKHANGGGEMSGEQLKKFLVKEQGEEEEKAERLVKKILICHGKDEVIDIGGFFSYLFSSDLNSPLIQEVHHDMGAPLSHYFIYTGHNSYLTGNQLTSTCSDSPIVEALKCGVKAIELDLWPCKRKVVKVVHGRTMTSPVELIKCLETIKKYAFQTSVYPVILTLEDHLTPQHRDYMTKTLKDVFRDMLYVAEPECSMEFPSPEKLSKRIIISTKPPQEIDEAMPSKTKQEGWWKRKPSLKESWGRELLSIAEDEEDNNVNGGLNDNSIERYFGKDEKSDKVSPTNHECKSLPSPNKPHSGGLLKGGNKNGYSEKSVMNDDYHMRDHDYKSLIAIPNRPRKGGLLKVLTRDPDKVSRLSMSEEVLKKAARSHAEDLLRFTQRNILRVYPKGSRVDSSNYNPLTGWTRGAQMVAFNMQGYGRPLWLMQGLFRANGGCGYFKKPSCLLHSESSNQIFNPTAPNLPLKQTLKVKVYMGDGWHVDFSRTYFDSYSPPDFYTKVGIAGVPADTGTMQETSTEENTWRPVWNKEFIFRLTVPELALLRIEVHERDIPDKDDFAGQTCLPVSEIRPGIRAVPLYDRKGVQYKSVRLLMHFAFL